MILTPRGEAERCYAIWRGGRRSGLSKSNTPPHWDDLAEFLQEAFTAVCVIAKQDAEFKGIPREKTDAD